MATSTIIEAEEAYISELISCACTALLIYECLITTDQAVTSVWAQKWTGVSILFILNQLVALLTNILGFVPYTPKSCQPFVYLLNALTLVQFLIIAAFCAIRVYALSGRTLWSAVVVFLLGSVPVGTNLFSYITGFVGVDPDNGVCSEVSLVSPWLTVRLSLTTRIAAIMCDVIVLAVTLHSTWSTYMDARKAGINMRFTSLLIRDGISYFLFLLGFHVTNLTFDLMQMPALSYIWVLNVTTSLLSPGVPILISRFILNLRQVAHEDVDSFSTNRGVMPVSSLGVRFANSIVGNLGEPLDRGSNDDCMENDELGCRRAHDK